MTTLQDLFVAYIDTSVSFQETTIAAEFEFVGSSVTPEQLAMIGVLDSVDIISIVPNAEIESGIFGDCAKVKSIELVVTGSRYDIDQLASLLKARKFGDDFYRVEK